MQRTFKRPYLIFSALALFWALEARAVDQYKLEIPAAVMAGDPDVPFTIHPLNAGQPDATASAIRFLNLPSGLSVTPSGGPVQGPTVFHLSVSATAAGPLLIQVRKMGDDKVAGSATLEVQAPVSSFQILPTGPVSGLRAGQPVKLQIIARDAKGQQVTAFQEDVDLVAAFGTVTPSSVSGDVFKDGAAVVSIRFSATQAFTNRNRLEVRARRQYGVQPMAALGVLDLALKPAGAGK